MAFIKHPSKLKTIWIFYSMLNGRNSLGNSLGNILLTFFREGKKTSICLLWKKKMFSIFPAIILIKPSIVLNKFPFPFILVNYWFLSWEMSFKYIIWKPDTINFPSWWSSFNLSGFFFLLTFLSFLMSQHQWMNLQSHYVEEVTDRKNYIYTMCIYRLFFLLLFISLENG